MVSQTQSDLTTKMVSLLQKLGEADDGDALLITSELVRIAAGDAGLDTVLKNPTSDVVRAVEDLQQNYPFRVFELFIQLGKISPQHFSALRDADGYLGTLRTHVSSDDLLLKINALDGVGHLVGLGTDGFKLSLESGLMQELYKGLGSINNEEVSMESSIIAVSCLKIIGSVFTKTDVSIFPSEDLEYVLSTFTKLLESERTSTDLREVVLRAVGSLGSTRSGLEVLFSRKDLLTKFANIVCHSSGSTLVEGLRSLSFIMEVTGKEVEEKTRTVFNMCFESPIPTLLRLSGILFDDIRVAAYAVMAGTMLHDWGIRLCADMPEFLGNILDRERDSSSIGKQWRYAIAQNVWKNPLSKQLLDEITISRLDSYMKDGPFFVPTAPSVAMESN